jgi:hypothetical protein
MSLIGKLNARSSGRQTDERIWMLVPNMTSHKKLTTAARETIRMMGNRGDTDGDDLDMMRRLVTALEAVDAPMMRRINSTRHARKARAVADAILRHHIGRDSLVPWRIRDPAWRFTTNAAWRQAHLIQPPLRHRAREAERHRTEALRKHATEREG